MQMDVDYDPEDLLIKFKRCLIIYSGLTFEIIQEKFPRAFLNMPDSRYNFISSEFSSFKTKVSEMFSLIPRVDPRNQSQAPFMANFVDNSVYLKILRDQKYAEEPHAVIMSDQFILETRKISYLDLTSKILSMGSILDSIKNTFPTLTLMQFNNNRPVTIESLNALDHFISTGNLIRANLFNYDQSIIKKIEDMILNFNQFVQDHFQDIVRSATTTLRTNGSFIALAVPSMEGKTQSAFVFRSVKPLYFPLSGYQIDQSPQPVYGNYAGLSDAIISYAGKDLDQIGRSKNISIPTLSDFSNLDIRGLDLWTLGFLCKLVENGRDIPADQWMRHHAQRPGFEFESRRLNSIPVDFFDGFVLFLDEFVGDKTGLYLRNLARGANLRCLVSNTNTRIANLAIGLASGGDGETIWSHVVCGLNSPETNVYVHSLLQVVRNIIGLGANDPRIGLFFNDFLTNQINHLRPGAANFLKAALDKCYVDLQNGSDITLCKVLDHVVRGLTDRLANRKIRLYKTDVAHWAKISLLFATAYENLPQPDLTEVQKSMHHPAFLENHLFNLVNPWKADEWVFMTFAGIGNQKDLSFRPGFNQPSWSEQLTYFKEKELFTILGCLAIPFVQSVTFVLNKDASSPAGVNEIDDPRDFKLPGNTLEITAVVSVADSTQHSFLPQNDMIISTYAGQYGPDFIKNLTVNLVTTASFTKFAFVDFQFPERKNGFDLELGFLAKCHMPFIYGVDHQIPVLDAISDHGSSVFFGIIERTADSAQIDSKFEMRFDNRSAVVTAECKNRRKTLDSGKLQKIIVKAISKHESKLCLVFCNKFSDRVKKESKFVSTCSDKRVNVYRVKRGTNPNNSYAFIVEQFSRHCPITDDPQTVCIVFEADRINPNR